MSDGLGNAVLGAYGLVGRVAVPLLPIALSWRASRGKEDRTRLDERFGRTTLSRPPGRLAWVHAASVGETNAVMPLVERLIESGVAVVFTTVTVTAAAIAAQRLPAGALHQFAPVDAPPLVGRFLDHWRPQMAIFVESELWPTTIARLSAAGIPQILVNARLSERSYRGWSRFAGVAQSVFGRVALCLAQTRQDGERYRALGARRVIVTGNLKFDAPAPDVDQAKLDEFHKLAAGRPVWVAASTHPGEEAIFGEAHRSLREQFPNLLTIVVPRHPDRGSDIRSSMSATGLTVAQRSKNEPISDATEVYVADTFGELGLFYRVAPVAFLGGSLVPHGGQNPIEPARLACAVLHGPHIHNFTEIFAAIDAAAPASEVADAASLASALGRLLADPATARRQADAAADALKPFSGALTATMTALDPYLRQGSGS
jgi:3-deoxy-D-manno-octulosonic-acid transferase